MRSAGTLSTGFLGGIVGGVIAGFAACGSRGWKVPTWARGLMPVLVIPLFATLISGFVMIVILGKPLSWLMEQLADGLNSMSGGSAIILGVVLGLMMAFDMGGPLNKTAYTFATAGLGAAATASGDAPELKIMASVMLAGMVPPLALALATVVRPQLFDLPERENGKAAWALGASFITEGAIPFAAADPLRVIPAIMLGCAVTGGLSQAFDVTLRAPHGGIFVLFAVGNMLGFLISLAAGVVVAAAAVIAAEVRRREHAERPPPERRTVPPHQRRSTMPTKTVVVGSAVGLHARPAAIISEAAGELDAEVTLAIPGGDPVDASSALMIMTLGAGNGDSVEVSSDDQAAVDKIAALVEQDLDA